MLSRRDAIKALTSLPAVTAINSVRLGPTDVIVVECAQHLTEAGRAHVTSVLRRVWPEQRIVVLDGSMSLKVIAEGNS